MRTPVQIRNRLQELSTLINQEPCSVLMDTIQLEQPKGWRGANVIVTNDFEIEPGWMEAHKLWVRTRHASALGWLLRQIRDEFMGWYNFRNKYGFFGSLGQAALQHLAQRQPEVEDPRPLLSAVLGQAEEWAQWLVRYGELPDNAPIVLHHTDAKGRQYRTDLQGRGTV